MSHPLEGPERLYSEAAEAYGGALERLARAYERDADARRDLLQEIHGSIRADRQREDRDDAEREHRLPPETAADAPELDEGHGRSVRAPGLYLKLIVFIGIMNAGHES